MPSSFTLSVGMRDLPHVLGLRHILFDCAEGFGHTLCGLEFELENDIDLESQTHVNAPP